MQKPELRRFEKLGEMMVQVYERYLPTAFDESMTLLEKMNKIIEYLNQIGRLTNDVVEEWNKVMEWILNDGLEDYVKETLEKWYEEGKFADLVIQVIDELKQFGVSIKTYGAVGDGKTDDIEAFEKAIASGYPVYIPNGKFAVSRSIKIPSNTVITGAGIDNAVVTFLDSVPLGDSLMINDNYATGNENIYLSDFTLDGNCQRFGVNAIGSGGSRDSNLSIHASKNVHIDRIKSINATLHGIDITCGGLDYPYMGDGTTAPYPSRDIYISDCEAAFFGDDGITTHHSEYITISNCNCHDPRLLDNCNGIEIDDGSRHVQLSNNTSKNCFGGVEIKAHGNVPAAYNVSINGHMSIGDVRSYNFRHIGHHSATDPESLSAKNIICNNLISVNPNNKRGFQNNASPRVLAVSAYYGVVVNGLSAYTTEPANLTETAISVQFRARNVSLSGIVMTGFSMAENAIYVIGGSRGGDSVNISNVTLNNSGRNGVAIGSGIDNVSITNVSAIGDGVANPIAIVKTVNSNPQISGVNGIGYPVVCQVAGINYNDGLTLFNGAFRAATSSSEYIHSEGFVLGGTSKSGATASKSGVVASSSSVANAERSLISGSAGCTTNGSYNTILGSLNCETTNTGNLISTSSASKASGNRNIVLASFGVLANGSYKVNGGYGGEGTPSATNIKWELDSLNGNIKAANAVTGANTWSDYGEYFETLDGQAIETGYLVTLEGGKIRKAQEGEKIIGAISETAGVVLGESTWNWQGQYLKNEFGGLIYETVEIDEGVFEKMPKVNPSYNPELDYMSREERPEWNIVGLVGQIMVRIDDTVKIGNGISAKDGIATDGDTGIVMEITTPYEPSKGYGVAKVLLK